MATIAPVEQTVGTQVFGHVLVGVDGSEAGRNAAVQASRLVAPEGTLELVTAVYIEASCSVLIARNAMSTGLFPMNIVVGIDGSPNSLDALTVGEYLRDRFDVPLRAILARHDDVDIVHAELNGLESPLVFQLGAPD
jgi:hypothetical protein